MACVPSPSLTIWGTTQITQTTSYYTTWTALAPQAPGVQIEDGRVAVKGAQQTVTLSTLVETVTVVPSVVPQRTLFYPCTETKTSALDPAFTLSSATATTSTEDIAPPFVETTTSSSQSANATPAPSSSSSSQSTATYSSSTSRILLSPSTPLIMPTTPMSTQQMSEAVSALASSSIAAPPSSTVNIGAGQSDMPDQTESSNGEMVGAIVGTLAGILLLIGLWFCYRHRRRDRHVQGGTGGRNDEEYAGPDDGGDYWERKFKALDSEAGSPQDEVQGMSAPTRLESPETKRLRVSCR